jgi:myo-inositol-1(or 4)-monophosphatase
VEVGIETVVALAEEAGRFALAEVAGVVAELKPDSSYVTRIDREVEATLREQLLRLHPEAGFWGEETGRERTRARDLWVVDPIDGTTNLVFGIPFWGVSIGMLREGRPHLGAFHIPPLGETYRAVAGEGAFCNGRPIAARRCDVLRAEDVISLSTECFVLLDLAGFPGRVRNLGSAATHGAYTARGALCAHVTRDDRLHDLAAVLCIAGEAGCRAEYLAGGALDLDPWIAGAVNREPLIIAPESTIALLRAFLRRRE